MNVRDVAVSGVFENYNPSRRLQKILRGRAVRRGLIHGRGPRKHDVPAIGLPAWSRKDWTRLVSDDREDDAPPRRRLDADAGL